ncbi:MAG: proline iminopeptidase-family hydrolase [Atopobiaceae bacterium]|nr:proline iminopeptidase-family hydrolase [Atopobiaceae bacterium]
MRVTEGKMPYLGFETYYRIVEPDEAHHGKVPLLLLHGGPGSTHNYFEVLDELADRDGRTLVMYDQLGCGESYVEGHEQLWTYRTWDEELIALREHLGLRRCHLLGQSWGGMLAIEYLVDYRPDGIASVILSSTLSSCALWGAEQHRRLRYLSDAERAAVTRAEATGAYDDPAFRAAEAHFMELFCAGPTSAHDPECLRRPKRAGRASYLATQGDNELSPTGIFRTWDYTARLHEISQPALIVSGTQDLCSPLVAKTMYDRLPRAQWELMAGCRHMCFVDDTARYLDILQEWLNRHDEAVA